MPTYEYLCQTCSHRFETWQKMTDEPLTVCPECGNHIRRVLFPAGVVFKGHGFYKTDHANSSTLPPGGETKTGENGHASSNGKSAESKPAESSSATNNASSSKSESAPAASSN
ncbi:MAG TPA: FmdB family zinc ribbon protein [Ktedonobacteraceae bacterium]|jgi:putative FmdB family regulatory protein|nr:FmdB family zinc ribbon protein [Ktedonobacteraceae bacterium]